MKELETKEQFVELRAQGRSFASIATDLDVSKATLINWSKEMKEDISNLRQLHLDALKEKYRLQEEMRLEFFGNQLDKLQGELQKRDLSEVRTDRLLDLVLKVLREAKEHEQPLTLRERRDPTMIEFSDFEGAVRQWQA